MEKRLINTLSLVLWLLVVISLFLFLRSWWLGTEIGLPWQIETNYQTQPLLLNYFNIDGKPGGIFVDQILALQSYFTESIQFDEQFQFYLLFAFLMTTLLATVLLSFLDRTSYLLAAGAICLMITQLQLEELNVLPEYITYIAVALFLLPSYYFQAFKPESPFSKRLLITLICFGSFIITIYTLSPVESISVVALGYGLLGPLILSSLLLLFVAGENIFSIFKVTTTAQPGKKGLIHFLIIGIIYVGISFVLFYQKEHELSWDADYLDPRLLVLFSLTSAYFSFDLRHRAYDAGIIKLFKHLLFPAAIFIFLLTYTFSVHSLNDSLQYALDWMIIITHLCLGVSYFIYALINFLPELIKGLPIWKAFYAGQRTAILTLRLLAFVLCIGAFLYLEHRPYYNAQAAQYNMLGDLAKHLGAKEVAKRYYQQALFNDFYSLKANYTLLEQAEQDFDKAEARSKIRTFLSRKDDPIARAKLANDYAGEKRLYQSLELLKDAEGSVDDAHVLNNLGLAHFYYANYDWAYKHLADAKGPVAEVNRLATTYLRTPKPDKPELESSASLAAQINLQALANQNEWSVNYNYTVNEDSLVRKNDLYYLYNAAISRQHDQHESIVNAIEYYLKNQKNDSYNTFLLTAKAFAHYHGGRVNQAFQTIDLVINRNPNTSGFESFLKAIWCFDQGLEGKTVQYINQAQQRGYQEEQLKLFIKQLKNIQNFDQKADISSSLAEALQVFVRAERIRALERVATQNAFDHESTLAAIDALSALNIDPKRIYELLLQASKINDQSPEILAAYILQCESMNLSGFADSALERYEGIASYDDFFELSKKVNELRSK